MLAEKCAEDDARLAQRGITLDESAVLAVLKQR
jgi:hypothetical protein